MDADRLTFVTTKGTRLVPNQVLDYYHGGQSIHIGRNYVIAYKDNPKYYNDNIEYEDEIFIIIVVGLITNLGDICESRHCDSFGNAFVEMVLESGINAIKSLRGNYCGCIYWKNTDQWTFFTSPTGDYPLFYSDLGELYVVSSDYNSITKIKHLLNKECEISICALYSMLSYGYMIDNWTYDRDIFRLTAGSLLNVSDGCGTPATYHRFKNVCLKNIDIADAIEIVDNSFRHAVARVFQKDLEYGYTNHLVDLSGGFDSRMVTWVAHDMGFTNITNICYSESNSEEFRSAVEVATALANNLVFLPLDYPQFVMRLDDFVRLNYGLSIAYGITGAIDLLSVLDLETRFGLEYTGLMGDCIVGSNVLKDEEDFGTRKYYGKYSRFLNFDPPDVIYSKYDNVEMFRLYTLEFNGTNCPNLIRRKYCEVISPFEDIDFMTDCLSIPISYRSNNLLYRKWIVSKYPEAAECYCAKCNGRIRDLSSLGIYVEKSKMKIGRILAEIYQKVGGRPNSSNMNPFEYWYESQEAIRKYMDNYFNANRDLLAINENLRVDAERMYLSGSVIDRVLVLTVLSGIRNTEY